MYIEPDNARRMTMRKSILLSSLILCLGLSAPAAAGENVVYNDGETRLEGYWVDAKCKADKPAPVVMIVHQWKGLGDYEKRRAEQIADHCYDAFAIDMYGQGVRPQSREDAGKQAGKYKNDPALARARLQAALAYARNRKDDEQTPVAVMGYCFGGTMALELARSGADIEGAISFHGGLSTPAPVTEPGIIQAAIQVHHGAADPHVPAEEVHAFMDEMNTADADWMLVHYADAVHAFTEQEAGNDPSTGAAYNEKADQRSWTATLNFLAEIFK